MTKFSLAILLIGLSAAASCAPYSTIESDPCAGANRPITLENLMQNSLVQSYERCLDVMRDVAAAELRN